MLQYWYVFMWHVPGFGGNLFNRAWYWFSFSTVHFNFFVLVSCYVLFVTLLFVIFSNRDRIKFIIIVFLIFASIDPVISFFLEMVSFYFKFLNFLLFWICIFSHTRLHSRYLILPIHQMAAWMHHCLSLLIPLGVHTRHPQ